MYIGLERLIVDLERMTCPRNTLDLMPGDKHRTFVKLKIHLSLALVLSFYSGLICGLSHINCKVSLTGLSKPDDLFAQKNAGSVIPSVNRFRSYLYRQPDDE